MHCWCGDAEEAAESRRRAQRNGARDAEELVIADQVENGRADHSVVQLRTLQDRLEHQASHDALTSLPNRATFVARTEAALAHRRGSDALVAVLFVDLDDFKTINDSLGHGVGDELLESVALRLRACVGLADVAARVGGDEALLRWKHPEQGVLPPGDFIPLAEETGHIVAIGQWVLEEACRQVVQAQRRRPLGKPLMLSVNLSVCQLRDAGLVDEIVELLDRTGFDPRNLML